MNIKKTIAKTLITIIAISIIAGTFKVARWSMKVAENKNAQSIHYVIN